VTGSGPDHATPPAGAAPTDAGPPAGRLVRAVRRWRATGLGDQLVLLLGYGAALLFIVLLGLLLTVRDGQVACAAGPVDRLPAQLTVTQGTATFDSDEDAKGDCSFPSLPADGLWVDLSPQEYDDAELCGSYLEVKGPDATLRAVVASECGTCEIGQIRLSRKAFDRVADLSDGEVPVSYRQVVDPPLPGPLTVMLSGDSDDDTFEILLDNHGNPLGSVEARAARDDWRPAERDRSNYWSIEGGLGPGPYAVRVTDSRGHRVTVDGIRLDPGTVQRTSVYMYGRGPSRPTPGRTRASTPVPTPPAAPSPTPTPTPSEVVLVDPPTPWPTGVPIPTGCRH
jgi:expansin (peptidoglycan-binding protein)